MVVSLTALPPDRLLPAPVAALVRDGEEIVASIARELRARRPAGAAVIDAHVHVGDDADGMIGDYDELIDMLDEHDVARAFAFCLNEPDREPGFRRPNDRTIAFAERSAGRLVAFARLDPADDAAGEAERCLDRGARGIKLHPRAQAFGVDDPRLRRVFALAAERRVPILIHGGPGIGGPAEHLQRLVDEHPGTLLIVAHAGVADMAGLCRRFAGRTDVAFDTSTWSVTDLLDLLSRVSPQQVLHASDYPYGQQPSALAVAMCAARCCGLDEDELAAMLGASAARFAQGETLGPLSPPRGPEVVCRPVVLARLHQYLSMAAAALLGRRRDAVGALELAEATCDDAPSGIDELRRIGGMVRVARALWGSLRDLQTDPARRATARAAIQLIQLADVLAVTTPPAAQEARP